MAIGVHLIKDPFDIESLLDFLEALIDSDAQQFTNSGFKAAFVFLPISKGADLNQFL